MIPKIIHKVLILNLVDPQYPVPEHLETNINAFKSLNPNYDVRLYRNIDCINYITEKCGKDSEELSAYTTLVPNAFKCDLFRLIVLFYDGGYYSDMRQLCLVPFDTVFGNDPTIDILSLSQSAVITNNAFIGAKPFHPAIKYAINIILKNVKNKYYGSGPTSPTGPNVWRKSIIATYTTMSPWHHYTVVNENYYRYQDTIFMIHKVPKPDGKAYRGGEWKEDGGNFYTKLWLHRLVYGEDTRQINGKLIFRFKR